MKVNTESACKTREAAKRGERDKPHYYLYPSPSKVFNYVGHLDSLKPIEVFELGIDWSTWGR